MDNRKNATISVPCAGVDAHAGREVQEQEQAEAESQKE